MRTLSLVLLRSLARVSDESMPSISVHSSICLLHGAPPQLVATPGAVTKLLKADTPRSAFDVPIKLPACNIQQIDTYGLRSYHI